jgi:AAA+ superfamily predicted ATPase
MHQLNRKNSIILKDHYSDSILYLFNSEYLFCNEKLKLVSFPEYLRDHLFQLGYHSTVFFDSKKGMHVLPSDKVSLENLRNYDRKIFALNNPLASSSPIASVEVKNRLSTSSGPKEVTKTKDINDKTYDTGVEVPELFHVMDQFDRFINKRYDEALLQDKIAIIIDGDALLTSSLSSPVSSYETSVLTFLNKWNDKNYVRPNTTIFIVFNGLDTDSNIVTKINTYLESNVARGRLAKLPPLHAILTNHENAYENLHRNIINVPNLPNKRELMSYLYRLKVLGEIDYDALDQEVIADVLFYFSRPHSYYDKEKRETIEDNYSYSLHNIHQRFLTWLQNQTKPVKVTPAILKESVFYVKIALSGEEQLNNIIGLNDIKKRLKDLKRLKEIKKSNQIASNQEPFKSRLFHETADTVGKNTKGELSFLFLGNPGTGKSTIGSIVGQLIKEAGYITSGHLVKKNAAKIKGSTVGSTIGELNNLTEKAIGGVLFIDEIATISSTDENQSVVAEFNSGILSATDETDDLVTVLAGYPKEVEAYLQTDPGLRGRFSSENTFYFKDYSGEELALLFNNQVQKYEFKKLNDGTEIRYQLAQNLVPSPEQNLLAGIMNQWYKVYHERGLLGWSNGRFVRDLVKTIINRMTLNDRDHIVTLDDMKIEFQGIQFSELIKSTKNEPLIGIQMLDNLIGLDQAKSTLKALEQQAALEFPIPHFYIFVGQPGTGKKTASRILAESLSQWKLTTDNKPDIIDYYKLSTTLNYGTLYEGKNQKTILTTAFDNLFDKATEQYLGNNELKSLFSDLDLMRGYYIFTISPQYVTPFKMHFERLWNASEIIYLEDFNNHQLSMLLVKKIKDNDYAIEEGFLDKIEGMVPLIKEAYPRLMNTDLVDKIFGLIGQNYRLRIQKQRQEKIIYVDKFIQLNDLENMEKELQKNGNR